MNILVLDFETGGLYPEVHAILSMGYVLLDDKLEYIDAGGYLVHPGAGLGVTEAAIEVNKLDPEVCRNYGTKEEDMLDHLAFLCQGANPVLMAGHNPHFDRAFWEACAVRNKKMMPANLSHRMLDTLTLGMSVMFQGSLAEAMPNCRLENLFSIGKCNGVIKPHEAESDARASAEVIRKVFYKRFGIGEPND